MLKLIMANNNKIISETKHVAKLFLFLFFKSFAKSSNLHVKSHHLSSMSPCYKWTVIGGINSESLWVYSKNVSPCEPGSYKIKWSVLEQRPEAGTQMCPITQNRKHSSITLKKPESRLWKKLTALTEIATHSHKGCFGNCREGFELQY